MGQKLVAAATRGTQKGMGGKGMEIGNNIPSPLSPFGREGDEKSPVHGSGGGFGGFLGGGANRFAGGIFRGFGQGRASGFGQTKRSYLDESKD